MSKQKVKYYRVEYTETGYGSLLVTASNKKEAEERGSRSLAEGNGDVNKSDYVITKVYPE